MKLIDRVNHWFFANIDVRQYALLRIGVGSVVLAYLYQLLPLAPLHFSSDGWLDAMATPNVNAISGWSLLFFFSNETQILAFWLLAMAFTAGFTIGFYTRLCGWMTWIALVSIWHRNPLVLDGDDAILRMALLYLAFAPCGNAYAIDALGKHKTTTTAIWPLRMIQIQLAIVYFASGWVKFHSPQWLDGSILQVILLHPQYSRWDFSPWIDQSWLLVVLAFLSHVIRWWEVLFPLLLWQRHSQFVCIAVGILFHLGLLVFMHLRLFPIIMLVLYIAYLPNSWFLSSLNSNTKL